MFATMPSVAYARMIKGAGTGEGIMVGSGLGVFIRLAVGTAEVAQELSKSVRRARHLLSVAGGPETK
jgi:hypothetical protein